MWEKLIFGYNWNIPEVVSEVSGAYNNEVAVFDNFYVVFDENINIIVAMFSNRNEGNSGEVV